MNRSENVNELFAALAQAQAEMPAAQKNSSNPFFKSKYADILEMVSATRPFLAKHGLAVTHIPDLDGLTEFCWVILGHSSGQYIAGRYLIRPIKDDAQSRGSYQSYMRRYSYRDITGCVTGDEDDDGETAMGRGRLEPRAGDFNRSEMISADLEQVIRQELEGYDDIARQILEGYRIKRLSDIKKDSFAGIIKRVRELKQIRASAQ